MTPILSRLREPSTWAAVTGLLATLGVQVDPGIMHDVTLAGAGLAGLAGILMRERGG